MNYMTDKIQDEYPFLFIDVGAMGGIPLKWNCMLDSMKVIAFEPDPREFSKLKGSNNIKYLNYALHNKSEDLRYYVTVEAGKSSVFEPNMELLSQYENVRRFQVITEEIIPSTRVRNLDAIIEENSIKDVDFLKIDTQGSELPILQGGTKTVLSKIFGAEIEVEFIEMYKNQPLFRNVDEFMDKKGFQLIDLRRAYWKRKDYYDFNGKGQLIFGDALYFKKLSVFCNELINVQDKSFGKNKIIKSILICLIYRMYDYAIAIVNIGFELRYYTDREYKDIISNIKKHSNKGLSNMHLNGRVYGLANSVLQKFKPKSYLGWADGDSEIGNIKAI